MPIAVMIEVDENTRSTTMICKITQKKALAFGCRHFPLARFNLGMNFVSRLRNQKQCHRRSG